jgi:hypothetical protein
MLSLELGLVPSNRSDRGHESGIRMCDLHASLAEFVARSSLRSYDLSRCDARSCVSGSLQPFYGSTCESSGSSFGRSRCLDFHCQNSRNPLRCHRMKVSVLTTRNAVRHSQNRPKADMTNRKSSSLVADAFYVPQTVLAVCGGRDSRPVVRKYSAYPPACDTPCCQKSLLSRISELPPAIRNRLRSRYRPLLVSRIGI